jgi:hypothetical protein
MLWALEYSSRNNPCWDIDECSPMVWKCVKHLVLSRVGVTLDGVLDWILDLLTTLTHNS